MSKVNETDCSDAVRAAAKLLYEAYIANSDGLNYQGLQCPAWDALTSAVRSHWCAAVVAATTGQPIISLRGQGVDCDLCEDKIEHIHVHQAKPEQLLLALGEARVALGNELIRNAELSRQVEAWRMRAAKHGCNVDDGDPDCG